jgi:hypothetical protein
MKSFRCSCGRKNSKGNVFSAVAGEKHCGVSPILLILSRKVLKLASGSEVADLVVFFLAGNVKTHSTHVYRGVL